MKYKASMCPGSMRTCCESLNLLCVNQPLEGGLIANWSNTSKCNEAKMESQSSAAITGRDSGVSFIHDTNTVRI